MPQKIICEECNEILYYGKDLKPPEETIQQSNGICQKCGKKLLFNPRKVDVIAVKK